MRYYMYRDERDRLWKWYLLSHDGRTIAHSMQAFFSADHCRESIASVMRAGPDTPIDECDLPLTTVESHRSNKTKRMKLASPSGSESESTSSEQFEDVGLKKKEPEPTVPPQQPNELPQIGR
ncbi:MAG TPA: YegP family protein [Burkholderiales bacterium]|nr:YegP family protein [Burkholderiales bacterium]